MRVLIEEALCKNQMDMHDKEYVMSVISAIAAQVAESLLSKSLHRAQEVKWKKHAVLAKSGKRAITAFC